jgi:hypothetical protein
MCEVAGVALGEESPFIKVSSCHLVGTCVPDLCAITSSNLRTSLQGRYSYHFTDEETKAQKG